MRWRMRRRERERREQKKEQEPEEPEEEPEEEQQKEEAEPDRPPWWPRPLGFFKSLYQSSQSPETHKKIFRGRIMLVGAYGAGKTSTKRSLFNEPHEARYLTTDGADIYSIDITEWIIKDCDAEYKGCKSIEETQKLLGDTLTRGVDLRHFILRTETTKVADVLDEVKLEGERISQVYGRLIDQLDLATDNKQSDGEKDDSDVHFSLWDFAGQSVYYITHQVFLASRVIYILVIDLTRSLDDVLSSEDGENWTQKQFLSFWMNSIHTHASRRSKIQLRQLDGSDKTAAAPPVIVLGTKKDLLIQHKDAAHVNADDEAMKQLDEIDKYLRKNATQAVYAHVVDLIAIDNKSRKSDDTTADPEVETLRQKLKQLAMEYFFRGKVPVKWIRLELALRKLQRQKISLEEVMEQGRKLELEDTETNEALAFFHSVGEILHFDSTPELKNIVILDVAWLVNLFKVLITQDITYKEKLAFPPIIRDFIEKLHDEGKLDEELLDHLLKHHDRHDDKVVFLQLMEMYDIICEMPIKRGEWHTYYLPSLLQKDAAGKNSIIFPAHSSPWCQLHFHFMGNFLPEGLFYRLVIRCLRQWPNHVPVIRKHKARLYFEHDNFHLTICKEGADIQLKILTVSSSGRHSSPLQPKSISNVRQLVEEQLRLVISTYTPNLVYKASLKCQCPNHKIGKLLPHSEDVDDRCVPISDDKTTTICNVSAMPLNPEDLEDLNKWYWEETSRVMKLPDSPGKSGDTNRHKEIDGLAGLFYLLKNELTKGDTRDMINLLKSQISRWDAEKFEDPFAVFNYLREKNYISENNLDLLKDVFRLMNKVPLIGLIDEYQQKKRH